MTPTVEQQVLTALETIKLTQKNQGDTLTRLDHTINGNGKPGLKTVVDRHDQSIKWYRKVGWAITIAFIGIGAGGFCTAAVYLIRVIH